MSRLKIKTALDFLSLFSRFITESKNGKRLQSNGKRLSQGSIKNYESSLLLLKRFCQATSMELRIRPLSSLNKREREREKNYWKKFYRNFTAYLYGTCGHYDNYVGQNIKIIRIFFNYLNKELGLGVGDYYKLFYVQREEIAIFPLTPEELNYLIYNEQFESSLTPRMKEVKDFFVFGCTVALRVSDLFALTRANLRISGSSYYLSVRSRKTDMNTLVRLPDYAVAIINRYSKKKGKLLPGFNLSNINKYIKVLLRQAQFTQEVFVCRTRRGKQVRMKKNEEGQGRVLRFCDVATTHTMRRTAITTMLSLGMPEQLVRQVSGHSPHSAAFYRYVSWVQAYQDTEIEKVFKRLKESGQSARIIA